MTASAPLLEVRHLSKDYAAHGGRVRRVVRAVDAVSLSVQAGETLGIVGESGSGKTTLARVVLGLTVPTSGQVLLDGRDVTHLSRPERLRLRREIQGVFQDPYAQLDPRQRVEQIIREPLDIHRVGDRRERLRRVHEVMDQVRLPKKYARSYPHELSGGLRQRVGIATALVLHPRVVVADEPVSALDVSVQAQILELLDRIQRETGITLIFISHDLGVVRDISHAVAVMCLGKVVEYGPVERVYASPHHPYTRALLSAILPTDPSLRYEPIELVGEVPSPLEHMEGCVFSSRCWLVEDVCRKVTPALIEYGPGHEAACHVEARRHASGGPGDGGRGAVGPSAVPINEKEAK